MRHVCSTVAEGVERAASSGRSSTSDAGKGAEEEEEEEDWSGQEGHRRQLSCQSCSGKSTSSIEGSSGCAPATSGKAAAAQGSGSGAEQSAAHGWGSSFSGGAQLLPALSTSPPAHSSRPSGASLSPTYSHGSSLCPLSPVQQLPILMQQAKPPGLGGGDDRREARPADASYAAEHSPTCPQDLLGGIIQQPMCTSSGQGSSTLGRRDHKGPAHELWGSSSTPVSICSVCRWGDGVMMRVCSVGRWGDDAGVQVG